MIRKVLSVVLCVMLLWGTVTPAFATSEPDNDIDATLIARGYPVAVLESLDISQKTELVDNPKLVYAGSCTIELSEDLDTNSQASNDGITPYAGQISTSDLSMALHVSVVLNDDDTLDCILVQFVYDWLNLPINRFQDSIAVSWDGSKVRLVDNTFRKTDCYNCTYTDYYGNTVTQNNVVHSSDTGYASAGPNGVSWYADLKGNVGVIVTDLYGYGSFQLASAHDVTLHEGQALTLFAKYVHPTLGISATINIAEYGSLTPTCAGDYNERGTQLTFTLVDVGA